jgi:hypothetical protein
MFLSETNKQTVSLYKEQTVSVCRQITCPINQREHIIILLRNMHVRQNSELEQSKVPPFPTYTCVHIMTQLDDHALGYNNEKAI